MKELKLDLGNGITLVAYENTGDGDEYREIAVDAIKNGNRTLVALVGKSWFNDPDEIHTYSYNDTDDEPVETLIHIQ